MTTLTGNFWKGSLEGDPVQHPSFLISSNSMFQELPCKYVRIMSVTEKCTEKMTKLGKEGLVISDSITWREFNNIVVGGLEFSAQADSTLILGE
jgi:hypothetical protein